MKNSLRFLFFFLLLTQICFAQLNLQTAKTNNKEGKELFNRQDKQLPIFNRDLKGRLSDKFLSPYSPNQLRNGTETPEFNSIPNSLPIDRFFVNSLKGGAYPHQMILSPQSQIYVLDTVFVLQVEDEYVPADTFRHLFSYNESTKRTSGLEQRLIDGSWVDNYRRTNTYDANNNMLTDLREYWVNGQWVNSGRYTYTYDTQGNRLTELLEWWEDGQWLNNWLDTYTYDTKGNMLTSLGENWTNGQWVNSQRGTYTYDTQGNRLVALYEDWNSLWVNSGRYTYTYDTQGNRLTELYEDWATGNWFNVWRWTYTYDIQGNMLTGLSENWENGQWANSWRWTYIYDIQGNMLTGLYENWENGQWINSWRWTYTYDVQGNMLTGLSENWENGQWVNGWLSTYAYDTQGNLTSYWLHTWFESFWIPANVNTYSGFEMYDMAGNKYRFWGHNFTFIHKLIVTEVASEGASAPEYYTLSQNYPNPFNPTTKIKYSVPQRAQVHITVFDVLGNTIETLVNGEKPSGTYALTWNAVKLPSGVYFYQLRAGGFVETKKMVLLK